MNQKTHGKVNILEGAKGTVLVVVDAPPYKAYETGAVMSNPAMKLFGSMIKPLGFAAEDFTFITPCPPVPEEFQKSESKIGKFLEEHRSEFLTVVSHYAAKARAVVVMGKCGNRQLAGKPTPVTKVRGTLTTRTATGNLPVIPLLGPAHVMTRPENKELFESDVRLIGALRDCNWSADEYRSTGDTTGYQWCLDLAPVIASKPKGIAIDCETVGLDWHKEGFRVLTLSITTSAGNAFVVPLDAEYFNDPKLRGESSKHLPLLTDGQIAKLKKQAKTLFKDADVSVVGHNLKFDIHCLHAIGLEVENWYADTMQLAFTVDENMMSKSLTECTRRWVPALAGYSDLFDANTDKANMQTVPHDEMLEYAGGDTDATIRLASILLKEAKQDTKNFNTFLKVQMPTLRAFVEVERNGLLVDKEALRSFEAELDVMEIELYHELISLVPKKVLAKHEKGWSFGSSAFVRDILFSKDGFNLKPLVFTSTTKHLPYYERIPSTSAKDHLPFFEDNEFVQKLMRYSKLSKMKSTYVGSEGRKTIKKFNRTAGGVVPARIQNYLNPYGIELPISKSFRRRRPLEGLKTKSGLPLNLPLTIKVSLKHAIRVDKFGNIEEHLIDPPSGFYQNLRYGNTIHASFLLHGTVTGRTSSRNPNLQNIPKRGELAKKFRKIFIAPEGYTLLEADLSQAEIRVAGWMANDKALIEIYKKGGDVHSATAAVVMDISEAKFLKGRKDETPLMSVLNEWPGAGTWVKSFGNNERQKLTVAQFCDFKRYQAKAVNFGFLYGMGVHGFRRYAKIDYGIDLTLEEAEDIHSKFFAKYSGLRAWHKGMKDFVEANKYVRSLHGALRRLQSVDSDDDAVQSGAVRQAVNSPVQRFASDLGLMALHRLVRDAPKDKIKPIMFIHDAIVVAVRNDYIEEGAAALKYYMESPPLEEWFGIKAPFPIVSDVSSGANLGAMEESEGLVAKAPPWASAGESEPSPALAEAWRKKKRRGIILAD